MKFQQSEMTACCFLLLLRLVRTSAFVAPKNSSKERRNIIRRIAKQGGLLNRLRDISHHHHGAILLGASSNEAVQSAKARDHGYLMAADAGPISPLCPLVETQIHYLIFRRLYSKRNRNYGEADRIQNGLENAGVYLQDKRKEWRADGFKHFGRKTSNCYVRRGGPGQLSQPELDSAALLVEKRAGFKRSKEFHLVDKLTDELKKVYNISVNDKRREWSVSNNKNDQYVPSPIAHPDDPTHTLDQATKSFIQERLNDRVVARRNKEYATADCIRDELLQDYSLVIDDRTKEWIVNARGNDAFVSGARASQRSAFVRTNDGKNVTLKTQSAVEKQVENVGADEGSVVLVPSPTGSDSVESKDGLHTLTVAVLKEKLRTAGLPVSGRKAALIERLSR